MAVIPIENSLAGSVAEHFDLLLAREVFIQREFRLRIVHNLIAAPGVKKADLRRAYSHPVALDQCRDFFREQSEDCSHAVLRHGGQREACDRGRVARCGGHRRAARGDASTRARFWRPGIEDDKRNFTRFFLIREDAAHSAGANKTSIAFGLKNMPGALFKALSVFAVRDISLSKIESRPMRGRPWEYVFYVDFLRGDDEAARQCSAAFGGGGRSGEGAGNLSGGVSSLVMRQHSTVARTPVRFETVKVAD